MEFNESLLRSWLDFIHLEDKAAAEIDYAKAFNGSLKDVNHNIKLKGNKLHITNRAVFDRVKKRVQDKSNTNKGRLSLSFPYICVNEKGKGKLKPLFIVDVEGIFTGDYCQDGWGLTELEFDPSSLNIQDILQLDDEELDDMSVGPNLVDFINKTFKIKGHTMEEVSSKLVDRCGALCGKRVTFKPEPYIFEYQGEGFNRSLKNDLIRIINKKTAELYNKNNLLTAYISNKNYAPKELFYGALGEYPPTDSQAQVIYNSVNNKIVAAQGPPGSGKTTLILNIVANQVVKGVISLIRDKKDLNCLTVIASTNNRAVDNAVEKLVELENEKGEGSLCLVGGNKEKIRQYAVEAINNKIDVLKTLDFNEEHYSRLAKKIMQRYNRIKGETDKFNNMISRVNKYDGSIAEKRTQCDARKKKCKYLREKLTHKGREFFGQGTQLDEQDLVKINPANYHRIHDLLIKYHQNFPRFFDWFRWRSRRHLRKLNMELEQLVEQTYCYSPELRMGLVQDESNLLRLKDKAFNVIKLIEIVEDLQRAKGQVDSLELDLKRLEYGQAKNKEEIRQWLESVASGKLQREEAERCFKDMAFEREDIFRLYHKLFFEENLELFRLCKDYLLQHVLKDRTRYVDVLEKYARLLSGTGDTGGLYKEVRQYAEGFYRSLSKVFPVFSCTLQSVSNMFMYTRPNLIDKVIVDEAGMVKCYQVAPLFFRADSAVVVGDPLQIPPVITHGKHVLEDYETNMFLKGFLKDHRMSEGALAGYISSYSPSSEQATAYHLAATCNFQAADSDEKYHELRLKEHFRCQKDIADYFNSICKYGLKVLTPKKTPRLGTNLVAYHVEGRMKGKANVDEINAVKLIISHLRKQGYSIGGPPDSGIGVITPYRVHCQELKRELEKEFEEFRTEENRIGTIHTFQGGEKDVIICSTKIFSRTHSDMFINKWPNLLNVAVSRAKELFILVGNLDKLRSSKGYAKQLVDHIEARGEILEINAPCDFTKDKLQSKSDVKTISDCDHIEIFDKAIDMCQQELVIVSPWIRGAARHLIDKLRNKEIEVTIMFGWREDDTNDKKIVKELRKLQNVKLIDCRVTGRGTHEKIVICDRKFAVVGSWNWLSHKYYKRCQIKSGNDKLIVRHEMSAVIYDEKEIEKLNEQLQRRFEGKKG